MSTYYTHTTIPVVRIKVTSKLIVIEHRTIGLDEEEWRYYNRIKLPVTLEYANRLREMYNLPDDVVRHLTATKS
jgi:hypothetical protein